MANLDLHLPEDVRRRYVQRRLLDFQHLEKELQTNSFSDFKRVGHQLKGNAASYGYPELEAIAESLESAGQNQNLDLAQLTLTKLKSWLDKNQCGTVTPST